MIVRSIGFKHGASTFKMDILSFNLTAQEIQIQGQSEGLQSCYDHI